MKSTVIKKGRATATTLRPIRVAKEVQAAVVAGRKPQLRKIMLKHGYSKSSALHGKVQQTTAYQQEMTSFADRLSLHREKILKRMEKTVSRAKYSDASLGLDRVTKVHQLLTGGATENVAVKVNQLSDSQLVALADGEEKK